MIDATPPALQADDRRVRAGAAARCSPSSACREDDISSYGVIAVEPAPELGPGVYRVRDLVEKPPRDEAPSDLAIIGRYILTPDIFPALAATQERSHRRDPADQRPARAAARRGRSTRCEVEGVRHDTGNKLGFLKAMVYFALRRPDLAEPFRDYLAEQGFKR